MGKVTGFLEIDRHDRKYAPVTERGRIQVELKTLIFQAMGR